MEFHSSVSVVPDSQPTRSVDDDIQKVRDEIQRLSSRRAILTASVLSSPSSQTLLAHAKAVPKFAHATTTLEKLITEQKSKDLENVHRMCAGVTAFEARDPDPNAVDNGRIIGIRFEVFDQRTRAFISPYYLLLNRSQAPQGALSVHRHTIPPCIPLSSLLARYLPDPSSANEDGITSQDLPRFVQELRHKLVLYHRRKDAIASITEAYQTKEEHTAGNTQYNVKAVDAELKDISIEWTGTDNGAVRISMTDKGELQKVVCLRGDGKRDTISERRLLGLHRIDQLPEFILSEG